MRPKYDGASAASTSDKPPAGAEPAGGSISSCYELGEPADEERGRRRNMRMKPVMMKSIVISLSIILLVALAGSVTASEADPTALPEGVSQDWWTTVQQQLQQQEYQITWQDQTPLADLPAAYQAPNRAQNFRTYFTTDGIRVVPRTVAQEAPAWEWGLEFVGYRTANQDLTGSSVR